MLNAFSLDKAKSFQILIMTKLKAFPGDESNFTESLDVCFSNVGKLCGKREKQKELPNIKVR